MFTIPLNYIGDPEASIIGGFRKSYHYNLIISPKKSLTTRIIELQKISPKLLTFLGLEDIIRLKKPASVTISRSESGNEGICILFLLFRLLTAYN